MIRWTDACHMLTQRNEAFVLATMLAVRGSTPRNADSKMVITEKEIFDSVGGGNLEYQITRKARKLLRENSTQKIIEEFSLGASLGQCCGGHASVLLEQFPATQFTIMLFGGGHVATALAKILVELPCKLHWVDSRQHFVETHSEQHCLQFHENPVELIQHAPAQTRYFIMTHDHGLDYSLCETVLSRNSRLYDVKFCGLIGSKSKASKFRKRLAFKNFHSSDIELLRCPVGLPQITGKEPMEIAVSIAAELLTGNTGENNSACSDNRGVSREQLMQLVQPSKSRAKVQP